MKLKHVFSTLALAAIASAGLVAGLQPSRGAEKVEAEDKATGAYGKTFYFSTNGNSDWSDCVGIKAYVFGKDTATWEKEVSVWCELTTISAPAADPTNTYYQLTYPTPDEGYSLYGLIFVGASDDNVWYRQTVDLYAEHFGSNNCFKINGTKSGNNYDCNWLNVEDLNVADGAYVRGRYHGAEEDFSNNITLSNDIVTESVTYDSSEKKFHATLELYAGDYIKLVRFEKGVIYWHTISSIESADTTYYPVGWEGNNAKVTNPGVYYIDAGIISSGNDAGNEYYYFDNSASAFAYHFLNESHCTDDNGGTEPTWDEGKSWSYFSTWYTDNLDDYAKDTFYTAASNSSGANIEKFVSRYFSIVGNHHYAPFLTNSSGEGRSSLPIAPAIGSYNGSNIMIYAIVFAASAFILVGGYFLFRKKKEN